MTRRLVALAVVLALVGGGLAWWFTRGDGAPDADGKPRPAAAYPSAVAADDPALDEGRSEPREDSYYPRVGDPGVDVLHYGLDLTWDHDAAELTGLATVTLRATEDARRFQLDLGQPLTVTDVLVDGRATSWTHPGKDLVVASPVTGDHRYTVQIAYHGTPQPVEAPVTRSDFSTVGWTTTPLNEVWTMQEPFGAFTWYPVNDQPSDKALYDLTIRVEAPWVGIANGAMTSRDVEDGQTVTQFHLDHPAASYLMTIAIGAYRSDELETDTGTPVTLWALPSQPGAFRDMRYVKPAVEWIEKRLGPYPFDTVGAVMTASDSAMETQTLLTLGNNEYVRSPEVIVHELVHQWYGDLVTPTDWRDMWMNEGMTMYLQFVYRAETTGQSIDTVMRTIRRYDQSLRDEAGPPGAYDPAMFGSSNVYYGPALMWNELRHRLGDDEFWRLVREWPQQHAYGNATRDEWFDWIEQESGQELTSFFDAWLMGRRTPPLRHGPSS
ncbi:MAG: M1 family metallopeptidase [Nocardioidaceae bacterium]